MSEHPQAGDSTRRVVDLASAGQRLDAFLAAQFGNYSRVQLRRMILSECVFVNGTQRKAAYHVRPGDVVEVRFPTSEFKDARPENIPLDVLHEDDDLIVINKPSGMVVHPAKGHWSGTLTAALAFHCQKLSSVGGPTRPGIVHRLDRDTSGVILVAKNDKAHLHLSKQFAARTVEKEYFAICRGAVDRDRDTIEQPIGAHPYHRERMAIRAGHPTSRPARTVYEVAERFRGFVAFRVMPKTGRTHQIRFHLSHIGCPVLCDPLYSGQSSLTYGDLSNDPTDRRILLDRLALHASRIRIRHPASDKEVEYRAEFPDELKTVLAVLRTVRC
jgi:23S rRNA pseudouridine1911/1915/1917 synthase